MVGVDLEVAEASDKMVTMEMVDEVSEEVVVEDSEEIVTVTTKEKAEEDLVGGDLVGETRTMKTVVVGVVEGGVTVGVKVGADGEDLGGGMMVTVEERDEGLVEAMEGEASVEVDVVMMMMVKEGAEEVGGALEEEAEEKAKKVN